MAAGKNVNDFCAHNLRLISFFVENLKMDYP